MINRNQRRLIKKLQKKQGKDFKMFDRLEIKPQRTPTNLIRGK